MNLFHCYLLKTNKECATYNTPEFKSITIRKLEVIRDNMAQDPLMLWVDNDIVFFENCLPDIMSKLGSFVMQNDIWGMCTGFFLARRNRASVTVINKSIEWLRHQTDPNKNDQHAFNMAMKTVWGLQVNSLRVEEYPNGLMYFKYNNKTEARMMHCNFFPSTPEKVMKLKECGFWDESDEGFNLVNKYYL